MEIGSRLHRNSGLFYEIQYGNRGIWFGLRVLQVLRDGKNQQLPKTLL